MQNNKVDSLKPSVTSLTPAETQRLIDALSSSTQSAIAKRIVKLLAEQPRTLTVDVNRICSVGNISDQVARRINPTLSKMGYLVGCERPPQFPLNRFGERTNMFQWSIYKLPDCDTEAANDKSIKPAANDSEFGGDA
jgi:hypothetical protein